MIFNFKFHFIFQIFSKDCLDHLNQLTRLSPVEILVKMSVEEVERLFLYTLNASCSSDQIARAEVRFLCLNVRFLQFFSP